MTSRRLLRLSVGIMALSLLIPTPSRAQQRVIVGVKNLGPAQITALRGEREQSRDGLTLKCIFTELSLIPPRQDLSTLQAESSKGFNDAGVRQLRGSLCSANDRAAPIPRLKEARPTPKTDSDTPSAGDGSSRTGY